MTCPDTSVNCVLDPENVDEDGPEWDADAGYPEDGEEDVGDDE